MGFWFFESGQALFPFQTWSFGFQTDFQIPSPTEELGQQRNRHQHCPKTQNCGGIGEVVTCSENPQNQQGAEWQGNRQDIDGQFHIEGLELGDDYDFESLDLQD